MPFRERMSSIMTSWRTNAGDRTNATQEQAAQMNPKRSLLSIAAVLVPGVISNYFHTPLVILLLLVYAWGMQMLIGLLPFKFPATVVSMFVLFAVLLLVHWISSTAPPLEDQESTPTLEFDHKPSDASSPSFALQTDQNEKQEDTARIPFPPPAHLKQGGTPVPVPTPDTKDNSLPYACIVPSKLLKKRKRVLLFDAVMMVLEKPCDWVLRNMGLFFCPSFILIPVRGNLTRREIGITTGCFVATFIIAWFLSVAIYTFLRYVSSLSFPDAIPFLGNRSDRAQGRGNAEEADAIERGDNIPDLETQAQNTKKLTVPGLSGSYPLEHNPSSSSEKTAVSGLWRVDTTPGLPLHGKIVDASRRGSLAAVRGPGDSTLTLVQGNSRRPSRVGIDEVEGGVDAIESRVVETRAVRGGASGREFDRFETLCEGVVGGKSEKKGSEKTGGGKPCGGNMLETGSQPTKPTLLQRTVLDLTLYAILFIIGLPLYYTSSADGSSAASRALPLFLSITAMCWIFATKVVPEQWRRWLHPILVTSLLTVLLIWMFAAIKGMGLKEALRLYSTSKNYLQLFSPSDAWTLASPGAGDVMSSILDAGILALALPLFRFRADLYRYFFLLIAVIVPNCCLSLFLWPVMARAMGLHGKLAISFAGRFSIVAVLLKDPLFRLTRSSDDFLCVGLTMGVISGAIGTSSLLATNQRAMAISTVSFALFGTVLLIAVAITPVAEFVGTLSGL